METRHKENRFRTSNLDVMKGKYTGSRVLRSWNEDFVDEDTGDVVSVERNEIVMDRGVLLNSENLAIINFHISAGDIQDIEVTDQQREGIFNEDWQTSIWIVTAVIHDKKKNYLLYARSVNNAFEIAVDFLEQKTPAGFGISSIKKYDSAYMVPENEDEESYVEKEFYKIELKVCENNEEDGPTHVFIIKTSDAEKGKKAIEEFMIEKFTREKRSTDFVTTIISAKTIPCESIIEMEFCEKYLPTDNE